MSEKSAKKKRKQQKHQMDARLRTVLDSKLIDQGEKQAVAQLLLMDSEPKPWDGQRYTPPGSIVEKIVARLARYTEAPLELAFAMTLQFIAAMLIRMGILIDVQGNMVELTVWLVVLAESGAGKTLLEDNIRKSLQRALAGLDEKIKPEELLWDLAAKSTSQWMFEWAGGEIKDAKGEVVGVEPSRNRTTIIMDEATDFFKNLKNPKGHLHDMYKNLLDAYSHRKIAHNTRGGGKLEVEHPVVGFLGMATPGRFCEQISEQDIEGGFFWRFALLLAGEKRSLFGKAIFPGDMMDGIEDAWTDLLKSISHETYVVSAKALEKFRSMFDTLVVQSERDNAFPSAYVRRVSWLVHRLALLYHLLLGKGGVQEIDVEDYDWAERLLAEFNRSTSWVLKQTFSSESVKMLRQVEELIVTRRAKGKSTTERDAINCIRGLCTRDARDYLRLANMKSGDADV